MFSKLVLPLLLLAATPVFAGDSSAPPMTRTLAWDMSLDASGKIVTLAAQGKDDEALQAKLEPVIRNRQFDPGRINSEPVATETRLNVQIELVPIEGSEQLAIKVQDVRTGGQVAAIGRHARFPKEAMRKMMSGRLAPVQRVLVEVSYDGTGKPMSVSVVPEVSSQDESLINASITAAKSWTIKPEQVAGVGVPGKLVSPLCYFIGNSVAEVNKRNTLCGWFSPIHKVSIGEGQSLALDSAVTLKTDVIGRML